MVCRIGCGNPSIAPIALRARPASSDPRCTSQTTEFAEASTGPAGTPGKPAPALVPWIPRVLLAEDDKELSGQASSKVGIASVTAASANFANEGSPRSQVIRPPLYHRRLSHWPFRL